MSFDTCNEKIADCSDDSVPVGKSCFKSFPYIDKNCVLFDWVPYNSNYWLSHSIMNNIPVTECILQCAKNSSCEAAKYNFNSGTCNLVYTNPNPVLPLPTEKDPPSCVGLYKKSRDTTGKCASVNKKDGSSSTIYFDQYTPADNVSKVSSDYQGIDCRKYAITNSLDVNKYKDGLQDFANWCEKNPDIVSCKSFCDNVNYAQFCKPPFPKQMIVYICLFFVFLFLSIFIYTKKFSTNRIWKLVFLFCIVLLIVFGGLSLWKGIYFAMNSGRYNGTTPDFVNSSALPQDCTQFRYDCNQIDGQSFCVVNKNNPDKAYYDSLWDCQDSVCTKRVKYNTPYYIWSNNGKGFASNGTDVVDKKDGVQFIIVPTNSDRNTKADIKYGEHVTIAMSNGGWINSVNNIIKRSTDVSPQIVMFVNAGKAIDDNYIITDQSKFRIQATNTSQQVGVINQRYWDVVLTWSFLGNDIFNFSEKLP